MRASGWFPGGAGVPAASREIRIERIRDAYVRTYGRTYGRAYGRTYGQDSVAGLDRRTLGAF